MLPLVGWLVMPFLSRFMCWSGQDGTTEELWGKAPPMDQTTHGEGGSTDWVAVKELKLSYYIGETLLFAIYTHYGNLI